MEADKILNGMNNVKLFLSLNLLWLLCSCGNPGNPVQPDSLIEEYLTDMSLGYWDLNYKFPSSYLESRDTEAWFFEQCREIDSSMLSVASELMYEDQDTALLITYHKDTLAFVKLPCSCGWTDEIPLGPRAYDSLNRMVLDDIIKNVTWHSDQVHLSYDLENKLQPVIEKRMSQIGYIRTQDDERKYPPDLLVEYLSEADSIMLIKVCKKYSHFFYTEYATILKEVFSEYCKANHISRLLTFVDVYLPKGQEKKIRKD